MFNKLIRFAALAAVLLTVCLHAVADKTYAERLGWKADDRVVIFHCDDAGMSHSSNLGAIEALEGNVLTSASTMMPCGWVPEFAAYLKDHPEVDNGLHLTLTSEWKKYRWGPLAGQAAVPGLVDSQGCMWHEVFQVVKHASPDEIEKEVRAQIARADAMGMHYTHLDSHMGTLFASPEYLMRWAAIAIEKQVPMLMMGGHMTYARKAYADKVDQLRDSGVPELIWNAGLPVIDDLAGQIQGSHPREKMVDNAIEMLSGLKPGITQIIVHCTRPSNVFPEISASGGKRLLELETMLDPRVEKCIKDEGIILTTWRELKERRDKV